MSNPNPVPPPKETRWKPGQSGNPKGRPKVSITAMVREKLQEIPKGEKKTYAQKLVKKIMDKALAKGDINMIKSVWQYMDGMPAQKIEGELDTTVNVNYLIAQIINNKNIDDGKKRTIVEVLKEPDQSK